MRKLRQAIVLLFGMAVIMFSLSGCANFIRIELLGMDPTLVAYLDAPEDFVVFRSEYEADTEENLYISVEELHAYETRYPDCNGTWFQDRFSGEERLIYNAHLYAMENCYGYFELFVADNEKDFTYIREALSLDSPFLEQNFAGDGEVNWVWEDGTRIGFSMQQFTRTRWELKMQALEVCKEVIAQIPQDCTTQEQIMQYLYHYVCDNVEYITYEDGFDQDFLYDAVCKGQTNCDGYSNMLSLLYNLAGLECCEAMGNELEDPDSATEEELEASEGHTWVVAEVDGVYYNYDPTYEDGIEGFMDERLLYFGFSDALLDMKSVDCDTLRPKCMDTSCDFDYTGLTVENITDKEQIRQLAKYTDSQTKNGVYTNYVLISSPVSEEAFDGLLDIYIEMVDNISHVTTSYLDFTDCSVIKFVTEPW